MAAQGVVSNTTWDNILSTTLNNYRKTFEDNVFTARPLLWFLKDKNKVRTISGGNKIVEQIANDTNPTVTTYAKYGVVTSSATAGDFEFITSAEYPWRQLAATISISGLEERQNNGEQEMIDLLESKIWVAEEGTAERLNKHLFLGSTDSGTGFATAGERWIGLADMVLNTAVAFGAITPTAGNGNFWTSYVESTAGPLSIADMTTGFNTVSRGNDSPDFLLTTQTLFEKYESLLQPQMRYMDQKVADGGFQNLLFKTAPIMFDTYCQSGVVYFLNSKYIKLVGHKDAWFTPTPFVKPYDRDARYAQILLQGNLTCSNRQRLGKLTARTA